MMLRLVTKLSRCLLGVSSSRPLLTKFALVILVGLAAHRTYAAAPVLSSLPDQEVTKNTTGGIIVKTVPYSVSDPDTPLSGLSIRVSSSNPSIVSFTDGHPPPYFIQMVIFRVLPNVEGVATVTVTISDGSGSDTETFKVTVGNPPTSQQLKYKYDALGRLTYVEDNLNQNDDFDYDPAGNRVRVAEGSPE